MQNVKRRDHKPASSRAPAHSRLCSPNIRHTICTHTHTHNFLLIVRAHSSSSIVSCVFQLGHAPREFGYAVCPHNICIPIRTAATICMQARRHIGECVFFFSVLRRASQRLVLAFCTVDRGSQLGFDVFIRLCLTDRPSCVHCFFPSTASCIQPYRVLSKSQLG